MKFTIDKNQLQEQPAILLRRAGYAYIRDKRNNQDSFVRRLGGNFYPRFHCYVFEQGGKITFNLHLDQRPTRYEGQRAHAGEYDSPVVEEEIERLQKIIEKQTELREITKEKPKKKSGWWPFSK